MARYVCRHCGHTVDRKSIKAWIKSYCATAGRVVHLQRLKTPEIVPFVFRGKS